MQRLSSFKRSAWEICSHNHYARIAFQAVCFSVAWIVLYECAKVFNIARSASAWYPAPGLTMAFVAALGPRYIPITAIAPILYDSDLALLSIASGVRHAVVYGIAGAVLRHSLEMPPAIRTRRDVNAFITVVVLSTLISALIAAVGLQHLWTSSTYTEIVLAFWIGDLAGALLSGPPLLFVFGWLVRRNDLKEIESWVPWNTHPSFLDASILVLVAIVAFYIDIAISSGGKAWFIVLFPASVLALNKGFGAAVGGLLIVNVAVVVLFIALGRTGDPAQLQVLLIVVDVAALMIGATITEYVAASERLRAAADSNAMLAAAVHASPISVTIVDARDPELRLLFANEAFYTLTRYRAAPAGGLTLLRLMANGSADIEAIKAAITRRELATFEADVVTEGQGLLRDRITVSPILRPDGEAPHAYLVLHEDVVASRERENLEREREKLVALGQLAGGVAHEINNLLHPIINLARDAERAWGQDRSSVQRQLRMIRTCGMKAADIVKRVLSFARQGNVPRAPLDFGEAVVSAVELARRTLPPTVGISVQVNAPGGAIHASATEVSQIVTNLLINASQAMQGKGDIEVSVDLIDPALISDTGIEINGLPRFRLIVSDNGPGMDADVRARIFEPFFTTKPIGEGTGLGLSVVFGIVKDWGGKIEVETAPGRGAKFIITVPCVNSLC